MVITKTSPYPDSRDQHVGARTGARVYEDRAQAHVTVVAQVMALGEEGAGTELFDGGCRCRRHDEDEELRYLDTSGLKHCAGLQHDHSSQCRRLKEFKLAPLGPCVCTDSEANSDRWLEGMELPYVELAS